MNAAKNIASHMYQNDAFSQWLGIEILESNPGSCVLQMSVRKEMTNGFGIAHGGITYSLADSALAFASNNHGQQAVSIETSISHIKPVKLGDSLKAFAKEVSLSNKLGVYQIEIYNQENILIALFKGCVYKTSKTWESMGYPQKQL